jgi:hypothetical protein
MPLARIITRNPQDAFAVSEYLRSEGYTVETVSPAEFRITPAELELDLSHCKKSEAVARAKAMVASRRGMAPLEQEAPAVPEPALPEKTKAPVAYDIVGRPVAFADEEEPERHQEPRGIRTPLAAWLNRVTAPVRDFRQRRAEQHALRLEAKSARRCEQELARERARQELERQRREAAERHRQDQIAAEQQAEQERARVTALREARIAAEREAARQQQPESAVAEKPALRQLPARGPSPARPFVARRRRPAPVILRRIVATGFGAGLLLLLGFIAYANRRPASPLSPGALMLNGSVKQEVPFGPVTITPPTAGVKTKPSPVRPAAQTPRRKPQPVVSAAKLKHDSDTE